MPKEMNGIFSSAWIYTRASMSIAIYLPPICDPKDGHMLLDGGYCNNQPADVMKKRGSNRIITINVGAEVLKIVAKTLMYFK
jgi:lysophospholipid hydrolase